MLFTRQTFILLCFAHLSFAATGTLTVYDQKFVNPKAGILKFKPWSADMKTLVRVVVNDLDKDIDFYLDPDCKGEPSQHIPKDRSILDLRNLWGTCLKVAA